MAEKMDMKRLIVEVRARPALWDCRTPEFVTFQKKDQAWKEVCAAVIPNYTVMDAAEKLQKYRLIRRKWKSLRAGYTTTVSVKMKKAKGEKIQRRKYKYHDEMKFLDPVIRLQNYRAKKSVGEESDNTNHQTVVNTYEAVNCVSDQIGDAKPNSGGQEQKNPRQRISSTPQITNAFSLPSSNAEFLEQERAATSEFTCQDASKHHDVEGMRGKEEDEDRLFLMSILKDVKKVDEADKLELKSEMVLLVRKWQRQRAARQVDSLLFL